MTSGSGKHGVNVSVFLAEGSPDGLRIVEKSNWNGKVLFSGVANIAPLLALPELAGPGVYLLIARNGDEPNSIYIGESVDVGKRLRQQISKGAENWQEVVVATAKDSSLNKAYVHWLEQRLISLAHESKRAKLSNGNSGFNSPLHEADVATLETYIDDLLMLLSLLGIDAFEIARKAPRADDQVTYRLTGAGGAMAEGFESGSKFIVVSGTARADSVAAMPSWAAGIRKHMLGSSLFVPEENDNWRLTEPYAFESPSAAASVFMGRSANGLLEWKAPDGKTLKAVREAQASLKG